MSSNRPTTRRPTLFNQTGLQIMSSSQGSVSTSTNTRSITNQQIQNSQQSTTTTSSKSPLLPLAFGQLSLEDLETDEQDNRPIPDERPREEKEVPRPATANQKRKMTSSLRPRLSPSIPESTPPSLLPLPPPTRRQIAGLQPPQRNNFQEVNPDLIDSDDELESNSMVQPFSPRKKQTLEKPEAATQVPQNPLSIFQQINPRPSTAPAPRLSQGAPLTCSTLSVFKI